MEWSKIKTILIWLFAVVNIFLFIMFFKGISSGTNISDETIENTIAVLFKNNVVITEDVIPKSYSNAKICNVENKYNSVSAMLENARKVSEQQGIDYLLEENTKIRGSTFTCTVNSDTKVSNTEKYAKKEIKKTGLLQDVQYTAEEKNGYVFFYLKYNNQIFYDCYIRVKCTETGIKEIYGHNWLGDSITEGGMAETVSPAEILINFAVQMKYSKPVTVESVNSGYYIGNRDETVRVTAFPVWEITMSDGNVFYFDMRNGDLLNKNEI